MYNTFTENYIITENGEIINKKSGKVLKHSINKAGYHYLTLYDLNGNHKKFLVHRLVAIAHIPNPSNLKQVNHKNMDKSDNRKTNLEWCSCKDNIRHARKNGANIYTKERNNKISETKRGVARSRETVEKMSNYMKSLPEKKKVEFTHHLHKNRPSPSCPLCQRTRIL